jgi:hypothetical protein
MGSTLTGLRPVCVASNFEMKSDTQSAKARFLQRVRIVEHRNELLRSVHGLSSVHSALEPAGTFNVQRPTLNVQRETTNHQPPPHQPVHGKRRTGGLPHNGPVAGGESGVVLPGRGGIGLRAWQSITGWLGVWEGVEEG